MSRPLFLGGLLITLFTTPLIAQRVSPEEDSDDRTKVRGLLKETAELAIQIDSAKDRAMVLLRIGEVSWRTGDKTAATESFEKAEKIVGTFPQENNDPNLRDRYRASLAGMRARVGDIQGAQQTLALVIVDSEKSGAFSDIALAQARAKDYGGAVKTASAISDSNFRDTNFQWIAYQEAKGGDTQDAAILARTIKNPVYRAEALAYIAGLKDDGSHTEETRVAVEAAVGVAEQMKPDEGHEGMSTLVACGSDIHEEARDVALERIAASQAGSGDFTGALETVRRIHNKAGVENMLAMVAGYQASAGDFAGATAAIAAISRDTCKAAALNDVAVAQFETGNLSAALITVSDMKDVAQRVSTLAYLARLMVEQGTFNSATMVLAAARSSASQVADDLRRADILEDIARIQVLAGNRNEAAKTLAEAVASVLAAHEQDKTKHRWSNALPDLIEQQAELGDLDAAWTNLGRLDESDRINTIQNAANALSKSGDTQLALAWADRQISARDRAIALVGVAAGLFERPKLEKEQAERPPFLASHPN